jgi:hypothetical protein
VKPEEIGINTLHAERMGGVKRCVAPEDQQLITTVALDCGALVGSVLAAKRY